MTTRDDFVRRMHDRLDQWNADIDALTARMEHVGADARDELGKQIDELRARQDDARARLDALRAAGEDAWGDLTAGVEMAWDAIAAALDSARARFGK